MQSRIYKLLLAMIISLSVVFTMVPQIIFAENSMENYSKQEFDQSVEIDGMVISVRADAGIFPKDSALSVETVSKSCKKEAEEAVSEIRDEERYVADSYVFDIKVLDREGKELQPKDGQNVDVSFATEALGVSSLEADIYHLNEADNNDNGLTVEKLEAKTNTDGEKVTAKTDGFSVYVVELTHEEYKYELQIGEKVSVNKLMEILGLSRGNYYADCITGVKSSNNDLLFVEQNGNLSYLKYYVTAKAAFDSEVTLKVSTKYYGTFTINAICRAEGDIEYIDRHWDGKKVVEETKVLKEGEYTLVTSESHSRYYNNGWYVFDGPVVYNERIDINGDDVNFVLKDGCKLDATRGIRVTTWSNHLKIWGQKNDSGQIIADGYNNGRAGIGGDEDKVAGSITINGGTIDADGDKNGAGIGGGNHKSGFKTITINGGNVTANGYSGSAAIGGGQQNRDCDNGAIIINGGTVKAYGGTQGASIGGGEDRTGAPITINGGKVIADNSDHHAYVYGLQGSGIGGGSGGTANTILITGGEVEAYAGRGAAIGGGRGKGIKSITITGGKVSARITGGKSHDTSKDIDGAAAIGGGAYGVQGGPINISGGQVYAYSNLGAGIGSGQQHEGGQINISGGDVYASSMDGAGIGGGYGGDGGEINISNGNVVAHSSGGGAGIGGGSGKDVSTGGNGGDVTVSGGCVFASSSEIEYDSLMNGIYYTGSASTDFIRAALDLIFSKTIEEESGGAGIGGGIGQHGGSFTFTGGKVFAKAGYNDAKAVGSGVVDDIKILNNGPLKIGKGTIVHYSTTMENDNSLVLAEKGMLTSNLSKYPYLVFQECDHKDATYKYQDEGHHTIDCKYCYPKQTDTLSHVWDESGTRCTLCGYERVKLTFSPGAGTLKDERRPMGPDWLAKDSSYTLVDPAGYYQPPEGQVFVGWMIEGLGASTKEIYPKGREFTLTESAVLTAQYSDPYSVWIGAVQVTESNKHDILGDGKISYDPDTCTLTLDEPAPVSVTSFYSSLVSAEGINLKIKGKGTLEAAEDSADICVNGITVTKGSLTFPEGAADLIIKGGSQLSSDGIHCALDTIVEKNNKITVSGANHGIRSGRNIYIKNGEDTYIEASGTRQGAIYTNGWINLGSMMAVTDPEDPHVSNCIYDNNNPDPEAKAQHVVIEPGDVTVRIKPGKGSGDVVTLKVPAYSEYTLPDSTEIEHDGTTSTFTPPEETAPLESSLGGWNVEADGTSSKHDVKDKIILTSPEIILTAQWQKCYPCWIGDTRVKENNMDDVLGDGTVRFTPTYDRSSDLFAGGQLQLNDLKSISGTHFGNLIYAEDMDLDICGNGSIKGSDEANSGVYVSDSGSMPRRLTFSGDISVEAESYAVYNITEGDIVIKKGTLTATGTGSTGYAIYSIGDIRIDNDVTKVEAFGGLPAKIIRPFKNKIILGNDLDVTTPEKGIIQEDANSGYWISDAEGNKVDHIIISRARHYETKMIWNDGDGTDRPEQVNVVVQQKDGSAEEDTWVTKKELTLKASDEWKAKFTLAEPGEVRVCELDVNGDPVEFNDTVATFGEDKNTRYVVDYEQDDGGSLTIINTRAVSVSGDVTWKDYDNQEDTRPETITLHLLNGDEEIASLDVAAGDQGVWTWTVEDLPGYDENKAAITYTVTADPVSYYTTTIDGYSIVNTLNEADQVVTIPSGKTLTYNGKTQIGVAEGSKYTVSGNTAKNAGSYEAIVSLKDETGYVWSDGTKEAKKIKWTINKAANPLTMKAKTATVKYSKLKKKAQTLAVTKVINFTKDAKDKKTYTLSSAKKGEKSFEKYFKINKTTGKVTVKKGLKKGTYKVKVKVKAAGNANYKASAEKTVTFTVKIK